MTRDRRARSYLFYATIVAWLVPAAAHAQSAEAEVLFREGRKLVKAGKLEAGCDKLEASERIEPSVGTLLNLGDCREKLGRLASAWAAFRKAESLAKLRGEPKRRNEASKRAQALEPRLAYMVIAPSVQIPGLVVMRDNEVIEPAMWSSLLPVDPDTYSIVAEAPGYKPWRVEVRVTDKQKRYVVTIPALERAPAAPPPLAPTELRIGGPAAPAPSPPATVTVKRAESSSWTTTRRIALGVGLGGALAVGTGVYYGLRSNDLEDQSDEICPREVCDDAAGLRLNDRAKDAALRANILYGAGGTALVTGVVLWVVGAPGGETTVAPMIGRDRAGASIRGKF